MSFNRNYSIHDRQQLIGINGDIVNFKAMFKVTCASNEEFEMIVANQSKLDSDEDLNFQRVKKEISGSITADNNVYENYYIVLKSQTPMEVNVEVNIEPLPFNHNKQISLSNNTLLNWKTILVIGGVVVISGAIIYYLYFYQSEPSKNESMRQFDEDIHRQRRRKTIYPESRFMEKRSKPRLERLEKDFPKLEHLEIPKIEKEPVLSAELNSTKPESPKELSAPSSPSLTDNEPNRSPGVPKSPIKMPKLSRFKFTKSDRNV